MFVVVLIQQCPAGAEARGKRGGFVFGSLVASLALVVVVVAPVCLSAVVVVGCLCFT